MSTTRDESYFENMDKRTKEYKEWKALKENQLAETSKGVGDTIEKITKATGIDKVVKTFFGEDCGCGERKEALNAALPYGVVAINCIDEDEFNDLKSFFSTCLLNAQQNISKEEEHLNKLWEEGKANDLSEEELTQQ